MSGYGKVISGGAKMSKGVTKGINDKLSAFSESHKRSATIASAVGRAFVGASLSDPQTNDIHQRGKFKTIKSPKNI
jgi:hypothetical protein